MSSMLAGDAPAREALSLRLSRINERIARNEPAPTGQRSYRRLKQDVENVLQSKTYPRHVAATAADWLNPLAAQLQSLSNELATLEETHQQFYNAARSQATVHRE